MNVWTGTVRIVADGETRFTGSGTAICSIRLVADSGYGEHKKPLWLTGKLIGKRAEGGLVQYLIKGQRLAVSGELSMDEWEDKNGQKRQTLVLLINTIDLIGGRSQQGGVEHDTGTFQPPPPMGDDTPF